LLKWFAKEARGHAVPKIIALAVVLSKLYLVILAIILFVGLQFGFAVSVPKCSPIIIIPFPEFLKPWYVRLLFLPPIEEVVFRFIPLYLAVRWWGLSYETLLTAVAVSAIFGFLHCGFALIPTYAALGLSFSVVWLKCGGFHGNYIKATIAAWAAHVCNNIIGQLILLSY